MTSVKVFVFQQSLSFWRLSYSKSLCLHKCKLTVIIACVVHFCHEIFDYKLNFLHMRMYCQYKCYLSSLNCIDLLFFLGVSITTIYYDNSSIDFYITLMVSITQKKNVTNGINSTYTFVPQKSGVER